jgi:PhnB protein
MKVVPHLSFDGDCEVAFKLYEQLFGGTIVTLLKYGESPLAQQFDAHMHQRILHATLALGDQVLFGSDVPPAEYRRPLGFSVAVSFADPEKTKHVFSGLAHGGQVRMKLHETFWSLAFGLVVDRFGIPWEVQCEQMPTRSA